MKFYTLDGTEVDENYTGDSIAFKDEESAVRYFDKKALQDNPNVVKKLDARDALEKKYKEGKLSKFEYQKAMDSLDNPPDELE